MAVVWRTLGETGQIEAFLRSSSGFVLFLVFFSLLFSSVSQRPYMTVGTLRDQLIYPDTKQQMSEKGLLDAKLAEYLQQVHLGYLLERENGWDAEQVRTQQKNQISC